MKIPRWQQAHPHIGLLPARKKACSRAYMQAFSHEKYLEVRNLYVKCLNWIGLIQINPRTKKQKIGLNVLAGVLAQIHDIYVACPVSSKHDLWYKKAA